MAKTTKNKMFLVLGFFVSLIVFELIIGIGTFEKNATEAARLGYDNPFVLFAPFGEAAFYHFIFVSFIAIIVKFIKKIPLEYKHVLYWFPLYTVYLAMPMCIPTIYIAKILNLC